jgi:hypothetical protein
MDEPEDSKPAKVWVSHRPEQRLSIAVDRLLDRTLLQPCYTTALHDADGVARTDNQRARDRTRGVKSGQLDWDVVQGNPPLARKLELKRGKGHLSPNQITTVAALTACGSPPVLAWTLTQAYEGLAGAGFRFSGNVRQVIAHLDQHLAAWDREAENLLLGITKRKPARKRKVEPRFTFGKTAVNRARKAGIRI